MPSLGFSRPHRPRRFKLTPEERLGSRELLKAIVETTPECIKVVAPDGRLLQMNPAGLRMIEADRFERVDGACVFDLIAPEHRAGWRANHQRVCAGESVSWEFDIIGLSGARRHVRTNAAPILLEDGEVGQLAVTRDITEHKITERALQRAKQALEQEVGERTRELAGAQRRLEETERGFALLVDSVTDYAIFMLDVTGRIVTWNAGARRIKGYEASEIVGRHFSCFYTDEDRAAGVPVRALRTAAEEGRFEAEGLRVRKDGTCFLANVVIDAVREHGELVGFAKVTRDITERRAAEAQLREAQKMEAVGRFTGGAAHDFNNLLMAVLGSLELLRKQLPENRRMLALLDNAAEGARRGASLTQRMLAFARRQELKREAVDLPRLVAGMREVLERAVGPAITIETDFPTRLRRGFTDARQLETALLNLTLNARDAMPGGGMLTIAAREERLDAGHPARLVPGAYVCLSVRDTGVGIDEATLGRVTEPFFTTKGVGKGTGLGLSMVDGLAAQSGGRLLITSKIGEGTLVELWLPIAEDTIAVAAPEAPLALHEPASAARSLVVLAIDDDSLVLMNTAAMLEDLGHRVIDVSSGAEALAVLDAEPAIDLVVSDQAMPGMTGAELAAAIRTRRPELPIILATGYAELPGGAEPAITRLAKPFTQAELIKALAAAGV